MRRALSFLLLAALPAVAETITWEPCHEEPPESEYDQPLCSEYEMNSTLIESAKAGDASALALLAERYRSTETHFERLRIAEAVLRKIDDDSAIWKEVYTNAQLALRFADDEDGYDAWCEERDCNEYDVRYVAHQAFAIAASDPRSHALLPKALATGNKDLVFTAIGGLAMQHDLSMLSAIDKALSQYPDDSQYIAPVLAELHDPRADAIMKKYVVEEDGEDDEEDDEDQR